MLLENITLKSNDYLDGLLACKLYEEYPFGKEINKIISFDKKFVNNLKNNALMHKEKIIINEELEIFI